MCGGLEPERCEPQRAVWPKSVGMILPTTESKLPQIPQVVVGVKPTGQPLVRKSGTTGPVRTQPDSIARSPDRGGSSEGGGRGAGGYLLSSHQWKSELSKWFFSPKLSRGGEESGRADLCGSPWRPTPNGLF